MRLGLLIIAGLLLSGCTVAPDKMEHIMKQEGITNYRLGGVAWFACAEDDKFSTTFEGEKNGVHVSGEVCGGFMKGYTVRYE